MANIFINYRRADTEADAGRLYDSLLSRLPDARIFMDIDSLEPGEDFVEKVKKTLSSAHLVLVVIGRTWSTASGTGGQRRLENPDDFVRLEIASALEQQVQIIPVLVQGAEMPTPHDLPEPLKKLAHRQAAELRHAHWNDDVAHLVERVAFLLGSEGMEREPAITTPGSHGRTRPWKTSTIIAGGLAVMVLSVVVVMLTGLWQLYDPAGTEVTETSRSSAPATAEETWPKPTPGPMSVDVDALRRQFADAIARADYGKALQAVTEALKARPDDPLVQNDLDRLLSTVKRQVERAFQAVPGASSGESRAGASYRNATRRRMEATRFEREGRKIDAVRSLIAARQSLDRDSDSAQATVTDTAPGPDHPSERPPGERPDVQGAPIEAPAEISSPPTQASTPTTETVIPGSVTPRPDSPPFGQPITAQRTAIEAVLQQYADGYTLRDPAAIRRVWPSAPAALADLTRMRSYRLTLVDKNVTIEGATARVTCIRKIAVQPPVGPEQFRDQSTVILLRRGPAGWVITSVQ